MLNDKIRKDMYGDLKKLLQIESVADEGTAGKNKPFGNALRQTLDCFLDMAKGYGLKCGELDGYCGYAEYGGGKEMLGILGHLDVVPSGGGWSVAPYDLTQKDGYLYGRGVVDNKGCVIVALHILKLLKDNKVKLNHRIRLIVGCNEENGSSCMKHYRKNGELPKISIVPDSDFPIINSEKGIMHLLAQVKADEAFKQSIEYIGSGSRPNVVPDYACVHIKNGSPYFNSLTLGGKSPKAFESNALSLVESLNLKKEDFTFSFSDTNVVIEARGIAGHAMRPDKADNAVFKIFALLSHLETAAGGKTATVINELICKPASLAHLGLALSDTQTGHLTMNLGIVNYADGILGLTLDFRLPISVDYKEIIKKIETALGKDTTVKVLHRAENLYIAEDNSVIQTLLKVYADSTGLKPYTVQTGGGTYARELPNAVAFGPTFPATVTNIHNIDERISIEQYEKLYDIYYKAVLALDSLK